VLAAALAADGELAAPAASAAAPHRPGVRWVSAAELVELHTPAELPALIAEAIRWAKQLR
jgi:hypothetical protein